MPAPRRAGLRARDLWSASRGFTLVWLVHLGRRYGLLEALASTTRPLAAATLSRRARADSRATKLWLDAAVAVGLVRVGNRGYWLPRHLVSLLTDPDDPGYLSGHLSYLALRSLDFDAFDEFFRDGLVSARRQRHLVEAFGEATRFDHTAFLEVALRRVPSLKARLAAGCDILDVGAGAGTWELRVAPRFPKSSFVGLEPDRTALRLAQADAARRKLSPRVQFVAGDAEAMRFVERFDVVYLGEMLCAALDPGRVLVRCRRALRLHGVIVICEGLVDETAAATDDQNAIVLPMQLEFALQPARFLGRRELHGLLTASGFGRARFVPVGGGLWFAIASRS